MTCSAPEPDTSTLEVIEGITIALAEARTLAMSSERMSRWSPMKMDFMD